MTRPVNFFLLSSILIISASIPAEAQTPRRNLLQGWGNGTEMVPDSKMIPRDRAGFPGETTPVPGNAVRVHNFGNKALSFSYFDGSIWPPITLSSGETLDVLCPACGGTVKISFHDGKENRVFDAIPGYSYKLSWVGETQSWAFTRQ